MCSNNLSNFFVSVISDSPRNVFSNLGMFIESGIGGLHFDAMDGIFVPRLGLHPELLRDLCGVSSFFVEVHMMLSHPISYIEQFVECGASRLLFHLETQDDIETLIDKTKSLGVEVGLVINPETNIENAFRHLSCVDSVMLMAIKPGIPRHPFLDVTYSRLSALRKEVERQKLSIDLQIDGGVTFSNVEKLLREGANTLICGSGTVFANENDILSNLRRLEEIMHRVKNEYTDKSD